ncbi:hypothetical protein RchiOBHm_Chr1g0330471 [Rosa chinensis]|uniref:Uncharacterized protein n=1 Tax=Rosa chinensis TaxID=74649 RepID=A0A2P6SBC2_ROSCH|nr:hypothetical protein RchiOBHm_Chr1g0330471 [Rosa chinensis]
MRNEAAQKRSGSTSAVVDYSDPFAILNLPERLDDNGGYGSVDKDMKEFLSWTQQILHPLFAKFPPLSTVYMEEGKRQSRLVSKFACQQATSLAQNNVIDLDNDLLDNNAPAASLPIVIIDSDEEHSEDQRPSYSFQEVFMIQPSEQVFRKDFRVRNCDENKVSVGEASPSAKSENNKDAGVYLGVEDDESTEEDDDLGDAWMEISMALESLKDVAVDPSSEQKTSEGGEDCDCERSFLLKDDLGYVCCICGVIERGIDMMFEFQYNKVKKSTRTCMPDSRNAKDRDLTEVGGVKLSEDGLIVPEISDTQDI